MKHMEKRVNIGVAIAATKPNAMPKTVTAHSGAFPPTTALSVNFHARPTASPRRIGSCVMPTVRVWAVAVMGTAENNVLQVN